QRIEIALAYQPVRLLGNRFHDVRHRGPLLEIARVEMAAAISGELKTDAADIRPGQAKLDDPAELVHVRMMIDGAHERAADVMPAQHVQGGELDLQKRLATQDIVSPVLQAVELQ